MGFRVDNGQVATLHLQRFAKDCQYTLVKIPLFLHSCSPSAELGGSYRSWYNHSSSFTIASVRIENHLRSWRRHQVLASWQSSQLNLVLPQSSCSTLVKISGRMLLVRLPGKPPNNGLWLSQKRYSCGVPKDLRYGMNTESVWKQENDKTPC